MLSTKEAVSRVGSDGGNCHRRLQKTPGGCPVFHTARPETSHSFRGCARGPRRNRQRQTLAGNNFEHGAVGRFYKVVARILKVDVKLKIRDVPFRKFAWIGRSERSVLNTFEHKEISLQYGVVLSVTIKPMASAMISSAIETTSLTRRFGEFTAVQDVNLCVGTGQFFGFLGPNGAGKSTSIKMLTGLLAPTTGSIRILGQDLTGNSAGLKRHVGVVPEGMALFGRLTAHEYLRFVGSMYGLDRATTLQRTQELLEFMNLADEPNKLITDFSHGMSYFCVVPINWCRRIGI
jgi:hypothetical protein